MALVLVAPPHGVLVCPFAVADDVVVDDSMHDKKTWPQAPHL